MNVFHQQDPTPNSDLNASGPAAFQRRRPSAAPTPEQLTALRTLKVQGMEFSEVFKAIFCKGSRHCIAMSPEGLHSLVGAEVLRHCAPHIRAELARHREGQKRSGLLVKLGQYVASRADQRRLGAELTAELCGSGVAEIETVITPFMLMGCGSHSAGEVLLVLKPTALGQAFEESLR